MTNVNGNYKNKSWKITKKIKAAAGKTKEFISKKKIKHGAQFSKYAGPTVGLFKKTGSLALGTGKLALRAGVLGVPGLAATGLYYGAKGIIKKGEKVAKRSAFKTFDKKGRWML